MRWTHQRNKLATDPEYRDRINEWKTKAYHRLRCGRLGYYEVAERLRKVLDAREEAGTIEPVQAIAYHQAIVVMEDDMARTTDRNKAVAMILEMEGLLRGEGGRSKGDPIKEAPTLDLISMITGEEDEKADQGVDQRAKTGDPERGPKRAVTFGEGEVFGDDG